MICLLTAIALTTADSSAVNICTQTNNTHNNIINNFGWKAFWVSNSEWSS